MEGKKKISKKKWLITLLPVGIFLFSIIAIVIFFQRAVVLTNTYDKDPQDVKALYGIIKEMRSYWVGYSRAHRMEYNEGKFNIDTNLNSEQYEWENGRLVAIYWDQWIGPNELSFAGLDELRILEFRNSSCDNLDVTQNAKLEYLDCTNVYMGESELDLSGNPELTYLNCSFSSLNNLDLSANTKLVHLNVSDNQRLAALDVSPLVNLEHLNISSTDIKHMDLSQNAQLRHLNMKYSYCTAIDLRWNVKLEHLDAEYSLLETLDVTANTNLQYLDIKDTQMNEAPNLDNNKKLESYYHNAF